VPSPAYAGPESSGGTTRRPRGTLRPPVGRRNRLRVRRRGARLDGRRLTPVRADDAGPGPPLGGPPLWRLSVELMTTDHLSTGRKEASPSVPGLRESRGRGFGLSTRPGGTISRPSPDGAAGTAAAGRPGTRTPPRSRTRSS
jgi:hypothetical protein